MKTVRLALPALLLAALCGCGDDPAAPGPPADWPSVEERTMDPDHAPTPFTAAQLRAAAVKGMQIVSVVEEAESGNYHAYHRFDDVVDEGALLTFYRTDMDGMPVGNADTQPFKWVELQQQMASLASKTTIGYETVTVPGGTYACMLYTVRTERPGAPSSAPPEPGSDGEPPKPPTERVEDRMWYAFDLPGPPIQWIRTVDGTQTMRLALLDRVVVPGAGGEPEKTAPGKKGDGK